MAVLIRLPCLAAPDWPEFRGPTEQGLATATNVPLHWSASSNVVWRVPVPGQGWSSPVLVGGRVYLTTAVAANGSEETSLRVVCLAAADGKTVWNVEVLRAAPELTQAIHKKNSLASPTTIVQDGRLFAHFGHMGTVALDLEGNVLWRQTGIRYAPLHGNGGSPALVDGLLVFSCDGLSDPFLVALDAASGLERWRTPRPTTAKNKFSFSTPSVIQLGGVLQVISPASGFIGGYDAQTGREIWRVEYGQGYSVITRPVFAHGLLYVSSSYDRPVLHAIDPAGAGGNVTATHLKWTHSRGAPNTPSPVVVGNEIYIVSDAGIASCLDARTGQLHWSERLGGGYSASPVGAEGRIYFQSEEGIGTVIQAGTTFAPLAKNDLGERSLASYAVTDNTLFIRTESHLWRIGRL